MRNGGQTDARSLRGAWGEEKRVKNTWEKGTTETKTNLQKPYCKPLLTFTTIVSPND